MSSIDMRVPTTAPPFAPPGWAGIGTWALSTDQVFAPRLLSHHLLLLTRGGHGTVGLDFDGHPCRPGTLLWARPGQALHLEEPGVDAILVMFDPQLAGDHDPTGPHRWQLEGEDEDAVISEVAQLAVDCDRHSPGPLAAALLRQQLGVLLLRLALLGGPAPAGSESLTYARFRRHLEDAHPASRRVEDYAAELGCSVRTLTRACLAITGRSAKQVVDDRVALQARRLLACTPLSVAEVGRTLGFPEPTNFGRFFHREVGTSPGQFRTDITAGPHGFVPVQRRPTD